MTDKASESLKIAVQGLVEECQNSIHWHQIILRHWQQPQNKVTNVTKKQMLEKIEQLEARIKVLEARPVYLVVPPAAPAIPYVPPYDFYNPWKYYTVTSDAFVPSPSDGMPIK